MNRARTQTLLTRRAIVAAGKDAGIFRTAVAGFSGRALALIALFVSVTAAQMALAQTETVIHSFASGKDGAYPYLATLVQDKTGKIYGTTQHGGANNAGTVFRISFTKTGKVQEKTLYSFTSAHGEVPYSGVILDKKGNIYGTTFVGGASNYGTVFKLTKTGVETVLHSFTNSPGDGAYPYAGLVMDTKGNLYGTTAHGGTSGNGTVFKITSAGVYSVLYNFSGSTDGANPIAGVIVDAAGNLYGTTNAGGAHSGGTVYKITSGGALSVLYAFLSQSGQDGVAPWSGLVMDASGNLYGTAQGGGTAGAGIVFEISSAGTYSVLYNFSGADGNAPYAGLVRDASGNLYGTTYSGGSSGLGTVFEVTGPGTEKVLHSFTGSPDGQNPQAGLLRDASGNLYGMTNGGGSFLLGVVFKVVP